MTRAVVPDKHKWHALFFKNSLINKDKPTCRQSSGFYSTCCLKKQKQQQQQVDEMKTPSTERDLISKIDCCLAWIKTCRLLAQSIRNRSVTVCHINIEYWRPLSSLTPHTGDLSSLFFSIILIIPSPEDLCCSGADLFYTIYNPVWQKRFKEKAGLMS